MGAALETTPAVTPGERFVPGLSALRSYERSWLRFDLVAGVVLAAALTIRPVALRGLALSPLDVAALGAAVAVAVALARGAADTGALLAGNGTGVVLLLLPAGVLRDP